GEFAGGRGAARLRGPRGRRDLPGARHLPRRLRAARDGPHALSGPRLPRIRRLGAHVFRWPVATPVRTSFGVMHDRPMMLVEAEDADGMSGWGEVWCNFPAVGAEHRARLVASVFAPLVEGVELGTPLAT